MRLQGILAVVVLSFLLCGNVLAEGDSKTTTEETKDLGRTEIRNHCSVNCLFLILRFFDKQTNYDELAKQLRPSSRGVSMAHVKRVSESIGLYATALELPTEMIAKLTEPFIAFVPPEEEGEIGHFVLIIPSKKSDIFWLLDPPDPKQKVKRSELLGIRFDSLHVLLLSSTKQAHDQALEKLYSDS